MSISQVLFTLLQIIVVILLIVWWLRWTPRGLELVTIFLFAAIGLAYLSTRIYSVPPYQVGCDGLCPGSLGYPYPSYHIEAGDIAIFDPVAFVKSAFFYYAVLLGFGATIAWLGRQFHWAARSWPQRFLFFLLTVVLPLATLPMWLPPPQPKVTGPEQRIVINAARDWNWQLHLRGFMDRRLALEDVRSVPDQERQRVCFRLYTWFYLPYRHIYIDMEPEGVRALTGAEIPLSESCWTQP